MVRGAAVGGAHGRIKPKEPSQSINDPDRPLYITLYKKFRAIQRTFKTLYIKLKKILYNSEKGKL